MKIIITGGKSAVALKLCKAFTGYDVILADYGEIPTVMLGSYQLISLGDKNEDTIAHQLLSCALDYGVDLILPLHLFEIEPLAKAGILFEEFNILLLLPPVNDLQNYNTEYGIKKQWTVFKLGEMLYSSMFFEQLSTLGLKNQLSGAFYIDVVDDILKLSLIRIP